MVARKYGIEDKMPILIAEKTGPHFAVGDTCYSWSEEIRVYNPNGKNNTVESFKLNGQEIQDKKIELDSKGGVYNIEMFM